jgi:hypothetical protein
VIRVSGTACGPRPSPRTGDEARFDDPSAEGFSGDPLPFLTVATDDEAGIDRNDELGDTLIGGRVGGDADADFVGDSALPHMAAAALTFEGVVFVGELPNDGSGEVGVDKDCFEGEVFVLKPAISVPGPGAGAGTDTGEIGSSSSASPISEFPSSPSSNSSKSFICGDVGGLIVYDVYYMPINVSDDVYLVKSSSVAIPSPRFTPHRYTQWI